MAGESGELIDFPTMPAEASSVVATAKLKLNGLGTLEGDVTEVRSGTAASPWRQSFDPKAEVDRKAMVETRVARSIPQYALRDITIENADDLSKDLVIRYHVTAPSYARHAVGMLLVRPHLVGQVSEGMIDLKERKYAYDTDGPIMVSEDVTITLPPGIKLDELPAPLNVTTPIATYVSDSKFEEGTLRYHRQYKLQKIRIPLASLPELNKVFSTATADERNSVVLK